MREMIIFRYAKAQKNLYLHYPLHVQEATVHTFNKVEEIRRNIACDSREMRAMKSPANIL